MENQTNDNINNAEVSQSEHLQINKSLPKESNLVENKSEITYEDVFAKLGKKIKDKEAFDALKKDYEKQFASSIAKNKVSDLEANLLNEYSEIRAELLSQKKLAEKMNIKKQELEDEAKSYFQKNGQEITQEEIDDLLAYKLVDNTEELDIIKQNPILAKRTMEALSIVKAKSQPLPKAITTQPSVTSEDLEEYKRLDKIRRTKGLTALTNQEQTERINLEKKIEAYHLNKK